jgi:hypothetical protein
MHYALCSTCRRHVRAEDPTCPFCASPTIANATSSGGARVGGVAPRAKRYALGAAVAATLGSVSCGGGTSTSVAADASISDAAGGDAANGDATASDGANGDGATSDAALTDSGSADAGSDACAPPPGCICDSQGQVACPAPPYGCVFPDDACDVVRA